MYPKDVALRCAHGELVKPGTRWYNPSFYGNFTLHIFNILVFKRPLATQPTNEDGIIFIRPRKRFSKNSGAGESAEIDTTIPMKHGFYPWLSITRALLISLGASHKFYYKDDDIPE